MGFLDSLDIAGRVCQHVGVQRVLTPTEDSKANSEITFAYDKVRRAELRRNSWRFAIKHAVLRAIDTTTMLLQPTAWSAAVHYLPGSIVTDDNGEMWITTLAGDNFNNEPGSTFVWDKYFGPVAVSLYSATTSYFAGELVYVLGTTPGTYQVYLSLTNANEDDPATATAWDAATVYNRGDSVSHGGFQWRSLIELNVGVTPAVVPTAFDIGATYAAGNTVTASDNFIYSSVGNGNIGHDPTTDGGVHWTNTGVAAGWARTPTITASSVSWRPLFCTVASLAFTYPIGCGPSSQSTTRNVFRLPAGYLRRAPQNPKSNVAPALGGMSGTMADDWEFEGNYIISAESQPIVLRFIADITDVTQMDDMFCEGLACRIGIAVCEPITQSSGKLQAIAAAYKMFMGEARTANAIEVGSEDPPDDPYLVVRL